MKPVPGVRSDFYAEASRLPKTKQDFQSQLLVFQNWRKDKRFEAYWFVLDALLNRTFDHVRKWTAIQAQLPLDDYDYDAVGRQEACDLEDARRRSS